jgi:Putative heme iron utilization protein
MKPRKPSRADAPKKLLRQARIASLGTLMPGGMPFVSLVNVATAHDGSPLLLISTLAVHTQNILRDNRVSLMVDERGFGNPLANGRLSLTGTLAATSDAEDIRRYLARQPDAHVYASIHDFGYYKMTVDGGHVVAGFGQIFDVKPADVITDIEDSRKFIDAEVGFVNHLNQDHADTCKLYATKLLGGKDGDWKCVGCDPDGLDLQLGRNALRLVFPHKVRTPGTLRKVLKQLADQARAAS